MTALRMRVAALAAIGLAMTVPAGAQTVGGPPPGGRIEVGVAGGWISGAALGEADATLRARGGGDFTLFTTESHIDAAPAFEVRAGLMLTRRYAAEVRVGISRPDIRTAISADAEGAPALDVRESVAQYTVEGALVVTPGNFRWAGLVPFASAGAGYLRQLHEGRTLVEHGIVYHVGGGVKRLLFARADGFLNGVGIRADARVSVHTGAIELGGGPRPHASVSGGAYVQF